MKKIILPIIGIFLFINLFAQSDLTKISYTDTFHVENTRKVFKPAKNWFYKVFSIETNTFRQSNNEMSFPQTFRNIEYRVALTETATNMLVFAITDLKYKNILGHNLPPNLISEFDIKAKDILKKFRVFMDTGEITPMESNSENLLIPVKTKLAENILSQSNAAGTELVKAGNSFFIGVSLCIVGSAVTFISSAAYNSKINNINNTAFANKNYEKSGDYKTDLNRAETFKTAFVGLGILTGLAGIVFDFKAWYHIRIAGKILESKSNNTGLFIQPNLNSISLVYKF